MHDFLETQIKASKKIVTWCTYIFVIFSLVSAILAIIFSKPKPAAASTFLNSSQLQSQTLNLENTAFLNTGKYQAVAMSSDPSGQHAAYTIIEYQTAAGISGYQIEYFDQNGFLQNSIGYGPEATIRTYKNNSVADGSTSTLQTL